MTKRRISLLIDEELYTRINESGNGLTETFVRGAILILEGKKEPQPDEDAARHDEKQFKGLEKQITILEKQLNVKDDQISTKDIQISELTKAMNAQAVHIQTLLNQKALEAPAAERKKPWYRFW